MNLETAVIKPEKNTRIYQRDTKKLQAQLLFLHFESPSEEMREERQKILKELIMGNCQI